MEKIIMLWFGPGFVVWFALSIWHMIISQKISFPSSLDGDLTAFQVMVYVTSVGPLLLLGALIILFSETINAILKKMPKKLRLQVFSTL